MPWKLVLGPARSVALSTAERERVANHEVAEALLDHETLDEQEILKVTGLPRAARLYDRPIPIRAAALSRPA